MKISLNTPTPIEEICFEGKLVYLKRDDLIHKDFSGNKARKFYHYLKGDFPGVKKIVSYGSSQSNAMYSLSVLAKARGWEFDYYVDHISDYLRTHPQGNYRRAIDNGMKITAGSEKEELNKALLGEEVLFVHEGGRQREAEQGIGILAEEIIAWQQERGITYLNIFLPAGTGTTALYLQKALHTSSSECFGRVYTTPCVGDTAYLARQFSTLEKDPTLHPTILDTEKRYHFGKLYRDSYKIWLKLRQETGVEFDLLYDPKGWMAMREHPDLFMEPILYIHQGGLMGNESMLPRYKRKYKDIYSENI